MIYTINVAKVLDRCAWDYGNFRSTHYFRVELDEPIEKVRQIVAELRTLYPPNSFKITCSVFKAIREEVMV
jgi:hypothetical protein